MPSEYVLTSPRELSLREYAEPALGADEVRVRTRITGIKQGTEMALYRGATPFAQSEFDRDWRAFMPRGSDRPPFYPARLGSWGVGEVLDVGAGVTRFKPGDIVHGDMLHRPTNVRAATGLFLLSPGLAPEAALFTDPALFALSVVHDAQVKVGDTVAVFGMGVLGLLAVQIARLQGAERVFAVDAIAARLAMAAQFGADLTLDATRCDAGLEIRRATSRKGADACIEISGTLAGLQAAIRAVHQGGIVAAAGYYKTGQTGLELGAEWHHNRPTLVSSMPVWGNPHRCAPMWDLQRVRETALRLLEAGRLQTAPMLTHRFNYADAPRAYALIDNTPEQAMKIVLEYP